MTLREYLDSLKDKTVAVIGIGVSNTPLLRLLLREKIRVTACDKRDRAALGALAEELEKVCCVRQTKCRQETMRCWSSPASSL